MQSKSLHHLHCLQNMTWPITSLFGSTPLNKFLLHLRPLKKLKKCFSKRKLIICRFDNQLTRGTEVANVVTALCLQTLSHVAPVNMQHCRFDNQLTRGTEVTNVVTALFLQTLSHVINRTPSTWSCITSSFRHEDLCEPENKYMMAGRPGRKPESLTPSFRRGCHLCHHYHYCHHCRLCYCPPAKFREGNSFLQVGVYSQNGVCGWGHMWL